jgi:hypothetical protein
MPAPVSARSQFDISYDAEPNSCDAENRSDERTHGANQLPVGAPVAEVPAYLLPAGGGGLRCGVGCGVATAVACGGLTLATSALLSPTVVGTLAGAVLGVDCSIAATVFCAELCE